MNVGAAATTTTRPALPSAGQAYDPVLRWLIFTGVSTFAALLLWRMGGVRLLVNADRTRIALAIAALYVVGCLHNLWCAARLSREAAASEVLRAGGPAQSGLFGDHARAMAAMGRRDPTILLRVLAERLGAGISFGALLGDIVMKLGLLGTIVGFILMLGPIAGLDPDDDGAARAAMRLMGEGMAVAMYTTLAGLVGSLLLRAQYAMLESATVCVFWDFVRWCETQGPHV